MSSSRTVIAAAQMCAWDENIEQNLREHERLIRLAAAHDVQLLVFPELSITGYVLEAAARLAFLPGDPRLGSLKRLAALHGMILVAGAPVRLGEALHIGAFILYPNGTEAPLHEALPLRGRGRLLYAESRQRPGDPAGRRENRTGSLL